MPISDFEKRCPHASAEIRDAWLRESNDDDDAIASVMTILRRVAPAEAARKLPQIEQTVIATRMAGPAKNTIDMLFESVSGFMPEAREEARTSAA